MAERTRCSGSRTLGSILAWQKRLASRIGTRLLVVHLVVLLVPVAGIEFARLYEQRLLHGLERDMLHQSVLVAELVRLDAARGRPIDAPEHATLLLRAARTTRTRIRLLDARGFVVADSHANGPPEGPEPGTARSRASVSRTSGPPWPDVPDRREVRDALAGRGPSTHTRYRSSTPSVLLFLANPIRMQGSVLGVVYVVRSTQPVLDDLHRIRADLTRMLAIALLATISITVLLSLSISRPLSRLAASARRIARGERDVPLRVEGSGEVRELAEAVATMTRRLEERIHYARDLASDVAHEFKSPLTSIRGAAELLADGAKDDPVAGPRFLANIALDVDRLDRLVSRLLELGRIEASVARPTPVDATALARRIAARCATPDVRVRVDAPPRETLLFAREEELETALVNLVENAVRFSPTDGEVLLRIDVLDDGIAFDVEDRGPGIPDADRERVFDRFFTTDAERNGTGLGLAIAESVATGHGGTLRLLRTAPGAGCLFRMLLPRGEPR